MRKLPIAIAGILIYLLGLPYQPAGAGQCAQPEAALGVERLVEVDASTGALFGGLTSQQHEPSFLKDKEVVLSFDDGPSPWVTPKILDALDKHCTKATFFSVGKMAVAYPDIAREIIARGHTLGGHTWSHPRQLPKMKPEKAQDEIERGFAALEAATGGGIAPFFRFTGLNDSAPLLKYLQQRGIASFTVDVVSDDSFIASPDELARVTLSRLDNRGSGILLFHDIKPATARAMPAILDGLKARGYKVVHMRHLKPVVAKADLVKGYSDKVAEKLAKSRLTPTLIPFYGVISELSETRGKALTAAMPEVSRVAPEARDRTKRPPVVLKSPPKSKNKPDSAKLPGNIPTTKPSFGPPADGDVLPWKSSIYRDDPEQRDGDYAGASSSPRPAGVGAPQVR